MTETTQQQRQGRGPWRAWLSFPLIAIVAVLDYVTGWELSFSIFYLAPIGLAAWWGGRRLGILASVLAAVVWLAVDLASPHYANLAVACWNGAVRLAFYLVVTILLTAHRAGKEMLEQAVRQRTRELEKALHDLRAEVEQRLAADEGRRRAESEVLRASEREQRRIGQDLHDSIQSSLVGVRMMADSLRSRDGRFPPDLDDRLGKLSDILAETVRQTRGLAASCCPADLKGDGLSLALGKLADTTTTVFRAPCEFRADGAVQIADEAKASHLYYIAREAVSNALKHARAGKITVALARREGDLVLSIDDDGVGVPANAAPVDGMGLRTMFFRASIIGGRLNVARRPEGGTAVECALAWDSIAVAAEGREGSSDSNVKC